MQAIPLADSCSQRCLVQVLSCLEETHQLLLVHGLHGVGEEEGLNSLIFAQELDDIDVTSWLVGQESVDYQVGVHWHHVEEEAREVTTDAIKSCGWTDITTYPVEILLEVRVRSVVDVLLILGSNYLFNQLGLVLLADGADWGNTFLDQELNDHSTDL